MRGALQGSGGLERFLMTGSWGWLRPRRGLSGLPSPRACDPDRDGQPSGCLQVLPKTSMRFPPIAQGWTDAGGSPLGWIATMIEHQRGSPGLHGNGRCGNERRKATEATSLRLMNPSIFFPREALLHRATLGLYDGTALPVLVRMHLILRPCRGTGVSMARRNPGKSPQLRTIDIAPLGIPHEHAG